MPITYTPRPDMAPFDWQIEFIWEILGGTIDQSQLNNVTLASILDLSSASGITLRRNGKAALKPSEANAIIKAYGLNTYLLDASLFDILDPAEFRAQLRNHGAGIHAYTNCRRLVQVLRRAMVGEGLTLSLLRGRGMRGIGYASAPRMPVIQLHPGEAIGVRVQGQPNRHIAIIQLKQGSRDLIETLAPTAMHPDTEILPARGGKGELTLPKDDSDGLIIEREQGHFRLMAIEGDEELISLFSAGELDHMGRQGAQPRADDDRPLTGTPVRLSDLDAGAILHWIEHHPTANVRVTELEFLVTEV